MTYSGLSELKPLDERWMLVALRYVETHWQREGTGPTWTQIGRKLGIARCNQAGRHSARMSHRMAKLARRGVTWDEDVPRSTRLTDAGRTLLALIDQESV